VQALEFKLQYCERKEKKKKINSLKLQLKSPAALSSPRGTPSFW
jgi:hypothetical protein